MQERNSSLDLLRIISCFAVIMIHVTPEYGALPYGHTASIIIQSIVRSGLPIFFMISGAFLLNRRIGSLKKFYLNRILAILIPFLVYGYIHYFAVHNIWNLSTNSLKVLVSPETVFNFIQAVTEGPRKNVGSFKSPHFWYVYTILGIYLITPLIKKALEAVPPNKCFLASGVISLIVFYNLYAGELNKLSSNIYPIIPVQSVGVWVLYFVLGGLIYRSSSVIELKKCISLIALSYIATCILNVYKSNHYGVNIRIWQEGANMVLMCCAIFYIFCHKINVSKNRFIEFIYPHTYGIYLSHIFIWYVIKDPIREIFPNVAIFSIVTGILVFAFSLALTILIDRLICVPLTNSLRVK